MGRVFYLLDVYKLGVIPPFFDGLPSSIYIEDFILLLVVLYWDESF